MFIFPGVLTSIFTKYLHNLIAASYRSHEQCVKTKTTPMNGRCSSGMGNDFTFFLNFFITQVNYNNNTNYLTWRQIRLPWVTFRSWFFGCRGLCGGNLVE